MIPYEKPHLSFREQIEHLEGAGLDCSSRGGEELACHLRDLGYYRVAAYTYPMRELIPTGRARETQHQYRYDRFVEGANLQDALALYKFDSGLRFKVFEGLKQLEIAVRVQVAYTLGARDTFGHLNVASLDQVACNRLPYTHVRDRYATEFAYWEGEYRKLISRSSRSEDYLRHFAAKYSSELPIWVAVEVMDFGTLTRLFGLMERADQNTIARQFGLTDGRRLGAWLVGLGQVRNTCAHHMRLWNRQLTKSLADLPVGIAGQELDHLSEVRKRNKLYPWMAVLAYLLRSYDPTTNWHRTFKTQIGKFPTSPFFSIERDMAFPAEWAVKELWSRAPESTRALER